MNITTSEIKYLITMGKNGLHNVTEIAEALHISKPSVSIMIKKMNLKGLIERENDYIRMSKSGEKHYNHYSELYDRVKNYFYNRNINNNVDNYIWLFISKINEQDLKKLLE